MRKVAVRADQHSEMLGHRALWQIVFRPHVLRISAIWKKLPLVGSLTFSQAGFEASLTPSAEID
jgi:hypothetical protein